MSKKHDPVLATAPYLEFEDSHAQGIGRPPTKYTQAVRDAIVDRISKGTRPEQAAVLAGISIQTFHNWMKKGREGHVHLWEFADAVERALAQFEDTTLDTIRQDPTSDNAKWILERRFPAGYSKDVAQKFAAALDDFMARLESSLPPDIFQMVLAAASGQAVALNAKPVFKLLEDNAGTEEDDSEEAPCESARSNDPELSDEVPDDEDE